MLNGVLNHHLQVSNPITTTTCASSFPNFNKFNSHVLCLRLPKRSFASFTVHSTDKLDPTSNLTSTVGSPILNPPIHPHIRILTFFACATAISATWLFCSAIPTLMAFKRAAESLEKLMDVAREELPDTMAAVRLSGMEISDLTMELSDLGQEITQGVKSSTRAVRLAEERLRRLTNMNPTGGGSNRKGKTQSGSS